MKKNEKKVYKVTAFGCLNPFQYESRIEFVTSMHEADIVVMPGGADWNPALYNQERYHRTDPVRADDDLRQLEYMTRAIRSEKFILGICRGAQGLCIAAGGALHQDVNNHTSGHNMVTWDNHILKTNSCHHQMLDLSQLIVNFDYQLIAEASVATMLNGAFINDKSFIEPEIVYFPRLRALAVQGHPEWSHSMPYETREYMWNTIDRLFGNGVKNRVINKNLVRMNDLIKISGPKRIQVSLFHQSKDEKNTNKEVIVINRKKDVSLPISNIIE